MRKLTSIVMVVCGIMVVAGIFLEWGGGQSGWDMMTDLGIDLAPGPLFMLIGGVLAILCSGMVVMGRGSLRTLRMLEIVSLVGVTLAVGPALCEVIPLGGDAEYGLYIAAAGAVIGVIVGALAATRITRKKVEAE